MNTASKRLQLDELGGDTGPPGKKLLVIDDDAELCELVSEYLETEGFEIDTEGSGDHGADRALESDYDLIILDVMLPGINGFEALRPVSYTHLTLPTILLV